MRERQFFCKKVWILQKGTVLTRGRGTAFGAGRKRRAQPEHFVKKRLAI